MSDEVSIYQFAKDYGVETETVRSWLRQGIIPYTLVNGKKMVKKSDIIKPILEDTEDPVV